MMSKASLARRYLVGSAFLLAACSDSTDSGPPSTDAGPQSDSSVDGAVDAASDASVDAPSDSGAGCTDCDPCKDPGAPKGCDTYGVPVDGRPNWQERQSYVLSNAARCDPKGYKQEYLSPLMADSDTSDSNVFDTSMYVAVPPLYWNDTLAEGARWHAEDKANCESGAGPHDACDGTKFPAWLDPFWSGTVVSENVFDWPFNQDRTWAILMVSGFLCEGPASTLGKLAECTPDGVDDGHRASIMSPEFAWMATGYAAKNGGGGFWEQAFAGAKKGEPPFAFPIVGGVHVFFGTEVRFLLDTYGATPPEAVDVLIDGVAHAMTLHLGSAEQGVWIYKESPSTACRSYVFQLTDSKGKIWRYPAKGALRTQGEGDCAESYSP